MSKVQWSYEDLTKKLDAHIPVFKRIGYDEIVAISRGGLTAAHYVAKELRLPVGVYFPSDGEEFPRLCLRKKSSKRILIIEDLVAQGRTFAELFTYMETTHQDLEWDFFAVLVDSLCSVDINWYAEKTSDWVVFPYEKYDKMTEGDRGLFRNGTDSYDKA